VAHEDGSEKIPVDDIVKGIEATRGIEAVALALNDPGGFDGKKSGSHTSSERAALTKWKSYNKLRRDGFDKIIKGRRRNGDFNSRRCSDSINVIETWPCQTAPELHKFL
jgi:hypothetical protein